MFATAIRYMAKKQRRVYLKTPREETLAICGALFDVVHKHGPLTIGKAWDHVKEVGSTGVTSKTHMKAVLRWLRERHKLKLICNHVGNQKEFLYCTFFAKPNLKQPEVESPTPKPTRSSKTTRVYPKLLG